ncbi:MAG: hypothetical protein ACRELD_12765, partial [Longimicrobiales bacterium]
ATTALAAARFSARAQREDGSWPYGTSRRDRFCDSFHTGYTLVALNMIGQSLRTAEFDPAVQRGLDYWRKAFLIGPAVAYHPGRPYPVDAHAVAHAIVTLCVFRPWLPDGLTKARRLAAWMLSQMRDPEGFFYYRRTRTRVNRIAYMRWVQAWMLLALAELATADAGPDPGGFGTEAATEHTGARQSETTRHERSRSRHPR